MYMWKSQNYLKELALSFCRVGSRDRTQGQNTSRGSKHLHPLSHLSLVLNKLFFFLITLPQGTAFNKSM